MVGARRLLDRLGSTTGDDDWISPCDATPAPDRRPEPNLSRLAQTIEAEIIPRLLLAHERVAAPVLRAPDEPLPTQEEICEFVRIVLEHEAVISCSYVHALIARGLSVETVLLHLLSPAARLLGDLWKEDLCSFVDVTVGLSRMQHILREIGARYERDLARGESERRVLLAPVPGEQHCFGLVVVEDFFRRAGFAVWGSITATKADLIAAVRREWFDVVGFSASCDILFDQIGSVIQAVRRASRNRNVGVLVGGRLFLDRPELVARAGADAAAADGKQAVAMLPRLIGTREARS